MRRNNSYQKAKPPTLIFFSLNPVRKTFSAIVTSCTTTHEEVLGSELTQKDPVSGRMVDEKKKLNFET
jgi:hypothetical protein